MTIDHDDIAALDEKLASQIGDDIQVIFNHEYLFKEARLTIRNLHDEVKRLQAERDHFEAALWRSCQVGGSTYLVERAEKAEAERDALRAALEEIADGLKGIARDIQIGPDDEGREIYEMVQALQSDARQALKGQTND